MNISYVLIIPSHKRPKTLFYKTYSLLKRTNAPEPIIWLNDNDDIEDYKKYIPNGIFKMGGSTLKEKRTLIQEEYPLDTKIVMIDDDIKNIVIYDEDEPKKKRDLKDFNALVSLAFNQLEKQNSSMWGVYPLDNSFFMKSAFRTNLCYCIGALFGIINKRISTETVFAEDFERSILHYNLDHKLLRLEFAGLTTRYYKEPGGLQESRTELNNCNDKTYIAQKYPELVKLVTKKNIANLVFTRTRANLIPVSLDKDI